MRKKILWLSFLLIIPLLFNSSCKSSSFDFDVNGTWEITVTYSCGAEYVFDVSFSGTATSGDVYLSGIKLGTYSVTDKSISFSYQTLENTVTYYYDYTGEAKAEDEMEGDITQSYEKTTLNNSNLSAPQIKVPVSKGTWKGKKKRGGK